MDIAIDFDSSIHDFKLNDTISSKNRWSRNVKYPLYHWDIANPDWTFYKEFILGFRKSQNMDTIYSWIRISIDPSGFIIREFGSK